MKKIIVMFLSVLIVSGCATNQPASTTTPEAEKAVTATSGNYTDEMKIDYLGKDLDEYGPDSVERSGDQQNSPYFSNLDFYNMTSTDTLTILPEFKTMQQTAEWSCGVDAALMVLNYYGKLGDLREEDLAKFRDNGLTPGATSLDQEIDIFNGVGGFKLESTYDYDVNDVETMQTEVFPMSRFKELLDEGTPILVCWIDWAGHWQVIIGYDDMGTEITNDDVIIVADPYDTTDHNQDGYGVYPAERFWYNWSMYDFFAATKDATERNMLFLIPTIAE